MHLLLDVQDLLGLGQLGALQQHISTIGGPRCVLTARETVMHTMLLLMMSFAALQAPRMGSTNKHVQLLCCSAASALLFSCCSCAFWAGATAAAQSSKL
jgi:hypothetical protein